MLTESIPQFTSVYGPVISWRYGRSLGIDPIGKISTCSFNCVYCQLGEIEQQKGYRALFIPTQQIIEDLQPFAPWDIDIITLSGSGEPTLALNLGEILTSLKTLTGKPTLVLTNGTLLKDPQVRQDLGKADKVSVKLDGVTPEQLRRINRPPSEYSLEEMLRSFQQFRQEYQGELSLQTMLLTPWDDTTQQTYINIVNSIHPLEIQLNTPKRPKPIKHQLEARGNHSHEWERPYEVRVLKCVSEAILKAFADRIEQETNIPVRYVSTV